MSLMLHIWEAGVAGRLPVDFEDARRQRDQLAGTEARSRATFARMGRVLADKFGAAAPTFEDDPSDWGADMATPCPAVWALPIAAERAGEVLPFLAAKALALGLVVLDQENAIFHKPKAMPEPPLQLESRVYVEDDRIAGVLTKVPSRTETIEQAVGDALADTLSRHAFKRTLPGQFERPFSDGTLHISVSASAIDDQSVGVDVSVDVTFTAVRELLVSIPRLEGSYPPAGPSMSSPLQLLASASPATQALFKGREPGRNTLVVKDAAQAGREAATEIAPMIRVVTDDKSPWFQNPKTVTDLYLQFYLDKTQAPAGFEFVCMEDLILTRLFSAKHFEALSQKRVHMEQRFAAEAPAPRRWNTVEGLQRVHAFTAAHVAPDTGAKVLRAASADVDTGPPQDSNPGRLAVVGVALTLTVLAWVCAAGQSRWALLDTLKAPSSLIALTASALAIFYSAGAITQRAWLIWLLPLTVFLSPMHAVVLGYVAYRLMARPSPAR